MYNRADLSDADLARLIPHVMGTQHPDNVSKVPFAPSPRVGRELEGEEVLYNVTILGLRELMIDYERKHGDCTPLWDWLHRCPTCLQEQVIGRDFHVTPRLPNPDTDRDDPYLWQSMGIFSQAVLVMHRMGYRGPAFTEFIIPDAKRGATLARLEADIGERYDLLRSQYGRHGDGGDFPYDGDFFIQGIPLIETVEDLLAPERIWEELVTARKRISGRDTHVQRSFIARSDPALKAGMVSALLAATVALDRGRAFEARTGIRVPQVVGIGSAPFRGGLTPDPDSLETTVSTYPGAVTFTAQSAFRYDHPEQEVIAAAAWLEERLSREWLERDRLAPLGRGEVAEVQAVVACFKEAYEDSFRQFLPAMSRLSREVPSHRERYQNVDVSGEVRRVGGLPAVRAIRFAASCYSLGIPPGVLGCRAWDRLPAARRTLVERVCPTVRRWLAQELRWANPDNLGRLGGLDLIEEDLRAAQSWAEVGDGDEEHQWVTAAVPPALTAGDPLGDLILRGAAIRGYLG